MNFNKRLVSMLVLLLLAAFITGAWAEKTAKDPYKEGFELFEKKHYKEAIPHFDKALEANKNYVKAYVFRGMSYYMLEDHAKAIADLNKAIQMDPENVTALFARGMAFLFTGKSKEAITDFTSVLKKQPENALSYFNRGVCYYRLNDTKKAISDASKAISNNPKNARAYFLRGACYWKQKLYEAAARDFKRAVELRPDGPNFQLMNYLAKAHNGDISTDQLKEFYEKNEKKASQWPYPAVGMMLGRVEPVDCLKAAEKYEPEKLRGTMVQQANFYVGGFFYIQKNQEKSDKYIKLAMEGENDLFIIQDLVKHEYHEAKK